MAIQSNFPNLKPSLLLDFVNAEQLDSRVTFTRASTAVYYNGSTTALADQNLLRYSQEFENALWFKSGLSVPINTVVAPDGTTTAETLTETATTGPHVIGMAETNFLSASGTMTFSFYAKANTRTACTIKSTQGATEYVVAVANLSAGTISAVTNSGTRYTNASASITSAGNGWYRLALTFTVSSLPPGDISIGMSNSATPTIINYGDVSYTGDGTSGFYIWGAQLEQRSAVTAYTATTTAAITTYNPVLLTAISGQPRFDHNPTTSESLGLLIEEQRTNLQPYSEQFGSWTIQPGGCSVQSNVTIAPNGTLTVDKLTSAPSSAGAQATRIYYPNNVTSGQAYTFSVYAKAGGYTKFSMIGSSSGWVGKTFEVKYDLSAGTITSQSLTDSASITSVGNGWYRCTVTATPVTTNSGTIPIDVLDSSGNASFVGNGFSGVYLWGAQFEAGSFATSYIATTTAATTRAEDNAQLSGTNFTSWFNNDEGTIYSDTTIVGLQPSAFPAIFALSGTDSNVNNLGIGVGSAASTYFASGWLGGSIQFNINMGSGVVAGTSGRTIVGYAANDFAASANAGTVGTASAGQVTPFTRFLIGGQATYQPKINAWYKRISYYPQRVTNAQLQALTS